MTLVTYKFSILNCLSLAKWTKNTETFNPTFSIAKIRFSRTRKVFRRNMRMLLKHKVYLEISILNAHETRIMAIKKTLFAIIKMSNVWLFALIHMCYGIHCCEFDLKVLWVLLCVRIFLHYYVENTMLCTKFIASNIKFDDFLMLSRLNGQCMNTKEPKIWQYIYSLEKLCSKFLEINGGSFHWAILHGRQNQRKNIVKKNENCYRKLLFVFWICQNDCLIFFGLYLFISGKKFHCQQSTQTLSIVLVVYLFVQIFVNALVRLYGSLNHTKQKLLHFHTH